MSCRRPPLALPFQAYIPGRTPRPRDGFFDAVKSGLSADLPPPALAVSDAFRGGLEAFARRYYWEAHELFEAVWHCLPPASAERQLLRGLIQLANAGLKARMGRPGAVRRILALADTGLAEARLRSPSRPMGLSRTDLAFLRQQIEAESVMENDAI